MKKAFITLLSVIIAGFISVAVAVTLLAVGISSSKSSFTLEWSKHAKALADACAEEALKQIRASTSFSGNGNLSLGQSSCSYTVVLLSGENRQIISTGTVGTIIRKVKISISAITPKITISSWQEVADF